MTRTNKVRQGKKSEKSEKKYRSKCTEQFRFTFGDRLKNARNHAKITKDGIADKLDVDGRTIQKWERGESTPNIEQLLAISQILDCDMEYLVGENKKEEYRKDISTASETTGLSYEAVEILNKSKSITSPSEILKNFFGKNFQLRTYTNTRKY